MRSSSRDVSVDKEELIKFYLDPDIEIFLKNSSTLRDGAFLQFGSYLWKN